MRHILYIHQYFITPDEPGGTRSYWIAKKMIESGYKVTMLTSRNKQEKLIERNSIEGINVIYIRNQYDNSFSIIRRAISFASFMLISTWLVVIIRKVDLIFSTSTPLTVGIPALVAKKIKKIPYIFEVRDLWPEVPIQMGALKSKLLRNIALLLEKSIYLNAKSIIALSPGMVEGVKKIVGNGIDIYMIPNMAKIDIFYDRNKDMEFMSRLNLKTDLFYGIHFGTIGLANGVDYIIEAAKLLKDRGNDKIHFIFAGGGSQQDLLETYCLNNNINNVVFLGKFALKEISELVNIASCSIVTFADIPILNTNSPNKLFDSLSAQRPIVVNSSGWTKDLVEKHKCGAYTDIKHPQELADVLEYWSNNRNIIKELGKNARNLAQNEYDKEILTKKIITILNSLV